VRVPDEIQEDLRVPEGRLPPWSLQLAFPPISAVRSRRGPSVPWSPPERMTRHPRHVGLGKVSAPACHPETNRRRSLVPVGNQGVSHAYNEDDAPVASDFLTLGHVLAAIGAQHDPPIGLDDIRVIRHSFNTGEELGLRGPEDLTEEKIRAYTRFQGISPRQFPAEPGRRRSATVPVVGSVREPR